MINKKTQNLLVKYKIKLINKDKNTPRKEFIANINDNKIMTFDLGRTETEINLKIYKQKNNKFIKNYYISDENIEKIIKILKSKKYKKIIETIEKYKN